MLHLSPEELGGGFLDSVGDHGLPKTGSAGGYRPDESGESGDIIVNDFWIASG